MLVVGLNTHTHTQYIHTVDPGIYGAEIQREIARESESESVLVSVRVVCAHRAHTHRARTHTHN